MAPDAGSIAAIVASLASLGMAAVSYLNSRNARRQSDQATLSADRKVELEAFEQAKTFWQDSIQESRASAQELRDKLALTRAELAQTQKELDKARKAAAEELIQRQFLEQRVNELQLTLGRLQHRLKEVGVTEFEESE